MYPNKSISGSAVTSMANDTTEATTKIKQLLERVQQDTAVIYTKIESIFKSSITTGLSTDSSATL
jgi:methyl-accepting chemotaxis protein